MKNITNILIALSLLLSLYLLLDKFLGSSTKKIGVVQMEKLVYDFKGMKEATEKYTKKMTAWSNQSDSLENKLKVMYDEIRADSITNDKVKLQKDIKMFLLFKQSYIEYTQNLQTNSEKEDKDMTIGVMNQVNEYIKNYAKQEGYDLILTNGAQATSVGFAKEQIDITQKVLEYANNNYEGKK